MSNPFFFSLKEIKPSANVEAGSLKSVTSKEVSGLVNISFAELKLEPGATFEPIWHPNAHKMGYCLTGMALVSIRSPTANEIFTVDEGDVFFIPQGCIHHIENIGERDVVIDFAFSHSDPETMRLSSAIDSLSAEVFTATFNEPASFLNGLKVSKNQVLIKRRPLQKKEAKGIANRYKFNIKASSKPVYTKGGYLQLATKTNLPVLEGVGLLGFGLNVKGVVEPHWHPNAGELVYIIKGQTRISVLSPNGKLHVFEVSGGEGAFAPASHFHNIENIGKDEVEVLAFFSHAEPDYIGIGEVMGSYDNELLASLFGVSATYFDQFKKPQGPLVIVPVS